MGARRVDFSVVVSPITASSSRRIVVVPQHVSCASPRQHVSALTNVMPINVISTNVMPTLATTSWRCLRKTTHLLHDAIACNFFLGQKQRPPTYELHLRTGRVGRQYYDSCTMTFFISDPMSQDAQAASQRAKRDLILSSITGPIPIVERTWSYAFAELLVAAVMLILPLIYLGMIGVLGYGIYWHATRNVWLMEYGKLGAVGFFIPLITGPVSLLFMIKPLFNWADSSENSRPLHREDEPLLFDFVDRLCEAVHAPKPKSIVLDTDVNASAGFREGIFSMFSNDLQLVIGLPLVAGLNLRQFSGVLAHEFGHFAQGASMRIDLSDAYRERLVCAGGL